MYKTYVRQHEITSSFSYSILQRNTLLRNVQVIVVLLFAFKYYIVHFNNEIEFIS